MLASPSHAPCGDGTLARAAVLESPDLLQRIFSRLDLEDRLSAVPLVCKSFCEALSCPGGWERLEMDGLAFRPPAAPTSEAGALFWRKLAAWVAPRACGLRSLNIRNLRPLLQVVEGAEARRDALSAVWAALAAAPVLHSLELGRSSVALPAGTLTDIAASLSGLRRLHLNSAGPLGCSELDALGAGLPQLEQLSVCLLRQRGQHCAFTGPFPRRLTALRHLRSLRLEAPYSALHTATCCLPDCIAEWGPQLHELHLINMGLELLPAAFGALHGLRELCLGRNRLGLRRDALPDELTQLTGLRRLELQYNGFEGGPPAVLGELASLEELNLGGNLWGSSPHTAMAPEFSQLRQLKYLTLTNCELTALPSVVCGMSRLQLLKLNINKIQTLPEGPYLASLECLDLAHNSFSSGYPPALAAATRLKQLSFQHRGVHYSDPAAALRHSVAELALLAGPVAAPPVVTVAALPPHEAAAVAAQA